MTTSDMQKQETIGDEELNDIVRFLLHHTFSNAPRNVVYEIARLIALHCRRETVVLDKAYAEIAAGIAPGAIRAKLQYYIKPNSENVRQSILAQDGYDIGGYFGVKNFIEQLALVYSAFRKSK